MTREQVVRGGLLIGLYLFACAFGVGSAWMLLRSSWLAQSVQVGPWTGSTLAGSTDAGMYTRGRVALDGLLALGRDETMYFVARTDSAGQPLLARCHYAITGTPPPARWWSITAYADDMFLFDAPNRRYSLNGSNAHLDAAGMFRLDTSPVAPTTTDGQTLAAWLPTPSGHGNGGLVLTLRLYNPQSVLQAAPGNLAGPRIERQGACT